jgi:hypothetical protein
VRDESSICRLLILPENFTGRWFIANRPSFVLIIACSTTATHVHNFRSA